MDKNFKYVRQNHSTSEFVLLIYRNFLFLALDSQAKGGYLGLNMTGAQNIPQFLLPKRLFITSISMP